jgi:hypothetical protein
VRLQEDAVDLLEVDGADAIAHGLEQRADAQVMGATEVALGGAHTYEYDKLNRKTKRTCR